MYIGWTCLAYSRTVCFAQAPKAHQQLNSMWHETRVEDIKQKVNMCSEVKLTMSGFLIYDVSCTFCYFYGNIVCWKYTA